VYFQSIDQNLLLNELSVLLPPVLVFLEGKIFPELSQVEWDFPLDKRLWLNFDQESIEII